MIVMKFGGSSVANAGRIRKASQIVKSQMDENPMVVVSGLGGVTDDLIEAAEAAAKGGNGTKKAEEIIERHYETISELGLYPEIIKSEVAEMRKLVKGISRARRLTGRSLDVMMSFGERMSARIVASCLSSIGIDAVACDSYDLGMLTDSNFGKADVLPEAYLKINKSLKKVIGVPVITGFIGRDKKGNVTTLGRGGSDYTACIVGAAINANQIQIWTNVNGIMTADPKIVDAARNIESVSYEEESELEFLGANTLHPKGILPAVRKNITVRILNTLNPEQRGTTIKREIKQGRRVASITHKQNMTVINIQDPKMLFTKGLPVGAIEIFQRNSLPVDMISTSKSNILVTVNGSSEAKTARVVSELKKIGKVEVRRKRAKVSIVGKSLSLIPGISSRMLSSMKDIPIETVSLGSSVTSQSIVVKEKYAKRGIRLLHKEFFGR